MTSMKNPHITVSYSYTDVQIARTYGVDEDVLLELARLDRDHRKPTGAYLDAWLERSGCRLDSSNGPAVVKHYGTGATVEEYYLDGKKHRDDGPATIFRNHRMIEAKYYRNGRLHRDGGPALVEQDANGSIVEQHFYRFGELHRENGPATFWRLGDGSTVEQYFQDGKLHRRDGPAIVTRYPDGSRKVNYYLYGQPFSKREYDAKRKCGIPHSAARPAVPKGPSGPA